MNTPLRDTIQSVMLSAAKKRTKHEKRPISILWDGKSVQTSDLLSVPQKGRVRAQFLSVKPGYDQGFDLMVNGYIDLGFSKKVKILRTWHDPTLDDVVEYEYYAPDGQLAFWNVYKRPLPSGQVIEEKWEGNAGFWKDSVGGSDIIYHCSSGELSEPDFEKMVVRITAI